MVISRHLSPTSSFQKTKDQGQTNESSRHGTCVEGVLVEDGSPTESVVVRGYRTFRKRHVPPVVVGPDRGVP